MQSKVSVALASSSSTDLPVSTQDKHPFHGLIGLSPVQSNSVEISKSKMMGRVFPMTSPAPVGHDVLWLHRLLCALTNIANEHHLVYKGVQSLWKLDIHRDPVTL